MKRDRIIEKGFAPAFLLLLFALVALDAGDELAKVALAWLDVEVRHAIDRWAIPVAGARARRPGQSCARLGAGSAKWAQQQAVADQVDTLGGRAFIVESVACRLTVTTGIEGHVEQRRSVAIVTEHIQGHEARTCVVAFVAQNAVELEGVPDALVDLQRHLTGHEQQVHPALRALGGLQQRQGLRRDPRPLIGEPQKPELLQPTLACAARAAAGAGLGLGARVGHGLQTGVDEMEALLDRRAVSADQQGIYAPVGQPGPPVHDAGIDLQGSARCLELADLVLDRQSLPRFGHRCLVASCDAAAREELCVQQAPRCGQYRPFASMLKRGAEPGRRQITGGGVSRAAGLDDADECPSAYQAVRRLNDVLAHGQRLLTLADQSQRPEVDRRDLFGKAPGNLFEARFHDCPGLPDILQSDCAIAPWDGHPSDIEGMSYPAR